MSPKIKYDQCHTDTDENVCHIEDRPDAEVEEVHHAADTHTEEYEPLSQIDTAQLLQNIDEALERMSVLRKTIFKMHRYEHKTYQEIADALMISPKTVQYHISCALSELRKLL